MMQSGTSFEQRKVLLANVRFSDSSEFKRRPVMIISNNQFNKTVDDVICCPITSSPYSKGVVINNSNLEYGKLLRESRIKSEYPFFLSKNDFHKEIGMVKKEIAEKIVDDIKKLIELS